MLQGCIQQQAYLITELSSNKEVNVLINLNICLGWFFRNATVSN